MHEIKSNPNEPTFVFDDLPLHWQMTRAEKFAFAAIADVANADVAIEIGTYKGGSLQVLSEKVKKVYSLDISPSCRETLETRFRNVEFLTGDSSLLLPTLLARIKKENESLGFVLIDGDHSAEGVRADINSVLEYVPTRPIYIIFHDSFNPNCRRGILSADWQDCPYVHFVETDFTPGVFHCEPFDTVNARSMWGGLALALMLPEKRSAELIVHQSQKGLFETVLANSCHSTASEKVSPALPVKSGILKRIKDTVRFRTRLRRLFEHHVTNRQA